MEKYRLKPPIQEGPLMASFTSQKSVIQKGLVSRRVLFNLLNLYLMKKIITLFLRVQNYNQRTSQQRIFLLKKVKLSISAILYSI